MYRNFCFSFAQECIKTTLEFKKDTCAKLKTFSLTAMMDQLAPKQQKLKINLCFCSKNISKYCCFAKFAELPRCKKSVWDYNPTDKYEAFG